MEPFGRRSPGDSPVPFAEEVNAWNDTAKAARPVKAGRLASPPPSAPVFPASTVLVRNDTGASLSQFSVVMLGEPVISAEGSPADVQRRPYFPGTVPVYQQVTPFAITTEPIPDGGFGRAVLDGMAVCTVNFTDPNHHYAGPLTGQTLYLGSRCEGPAKILHRYGSSGAQVCVVQLGTGDCNPRWGADLYTLRGSRGTDLSHQFSLSVTTSQQNPFGRWGTNFTPSGSLGVWLIPPFPAGALVHGRVTVELIVSKPALAANQSAKLSIGARLAQFSSASVHSTDSADVAEVQFKNINGTIHATADVPVRDNQAEGSGSVIVTGQAGWDFYSAEPGGIAGYPDPFCLRVWVDGYGWPNGAVIGTLTVKGCGGGLTAGWWQLHCCPPESYPITGFANEEVPPKEEPEPPETDPKADPVPDPDPGDPRKFTAGTSVAWTANPTGGRNHPSASYSGFTWYANGVLKATTENPTFTLDDEGEYLVEVFFEDDADPPARGYGSYRVNVIAEGTRTVTAADDTITKTVRGTDRLILCDATLSGFAFTLISLADWVAGEEVTIMKTDSTGSAIQVTRDGSDTINGLTTPHTLSAQWQFVTLKKGTASNWVIVGQT